MRHRPVGLGVQGLADVFALMDLPWESPAAADLNQRIFEHMYYAAIQTSHEEALRTTSYSSFPGSPASQGLLQPDLWGITPLTEQDKTLDWSALRAKASTALANSLLIAPMPTASTSQILGNNETIEPFTSNIYTRRTLAGEFIIVNRHLVADLTAAGLWSEEMKQLIIACNGSVQQLDVIPAALKEKYKTSWELKQKTLIDMAAARGAFVCQSQSLNLFVSDPTYSKLTSMHFYAWKRGLKTGLYYLRTKAGVQAQKFTVDPKLLASIQAKAQAEPKPVEVKKETRKEMLDRLAREYEEEQAKECTMCSA
jgi:ribonucleoside-diphosphate reductase alpha chain